jgi:hypothetical protein
MTKAAVLITVTCIWFLLSACLASTLLGVTWSCDLGLGSAREGRVYAFLAKFSVQLVYKK